MGKATKWLKSLLGMKKNSEKDKTLPKLTTNNNSKISENVKREKMGGVGIEKRWSFAKVGKEEKVNQSKWFREYISEEAGNEQSKHAIAVAAATAAAADAAVAAAQAAVAVVRLTSQNRGALFSSAGSNNNNNNDKLAAVKIQTFFRGYLARRALRALKGLVKLQALVRGYLVRKRAAATLHSMQALIRAQATVRSQRTNQALNKTNKVQSEFRPRRSTERFDETKNDHFHSKRLSTSYEPSSYNPYEGSPKIVEIDTYKPRSRSRRINPTVYDFASDDFQYPTMSSPLPCPCPAPARLSIPDCRNSIHHNGYDWTFYGDECRISTAHSTPRVSNSIRSNGPATPTKSVCGDTFFKTHSNHPSYMADTQSFRAKLRSHSAPKQRPEGRPKKVLTLDEILAARNSISGVRMQRSCSQVQETLNL